METARFFHQFAALLKSGISVQQSLDMAGRDCSPAFQQYLQTVSQNVQSGRELSAAMGVGKTPFDAWTLSLIRAADFSGTLVETCEQIAIAQETEQKRRRLYRSALFSSIGVAVGVILWLGVLLPREALFLLAVVVLLLAGFVAVQTAGAGDFIGALYRMGIRVSPIKDIVQARSMLYLAELQLPLRAGIPVLQALDQIRQQVPDPELAKALETAAQQTRKGRSLSQSLSGKLPPIAAQMIRTGEETGKLDEMLVKIREFYDGELERNLRVLQGILRPLGILAAGSVVLLLGVRLISTLLQSLPG